MDVEGKHLPLMLCRTETGEKIQREWRDNADLTNCVWSGKECAMTLGRQEDERMQ